MKIIGITGSMAMGKSTTVQLLKQLGKYPIFDADAGVKRLYGRAPVIQKIATLDPGIVRTGKIQRGELTDFLLKDVENLLRLENILYPELAVIRKKFLVKCQNLGMKLVFLDIPLLIEKHMQSLCNYIIVVDCPEWLQQKRLKWRGGQSEELKKFLRQQQMASHEKIKYADFVIQTGLGRYHTMQQLKAIIRIINSHG